MTAGLEPLVAMAATPREWGQTLHRHLADHGGARLRATVLHPDDALAEDYDVLVADDATSFLTPRLVNELSRRGRAVLGVFDPDDPDGKERLRDLGVADVVERDAGPAEIVQRLASLAGELPAARVTTGEAPLPSPPQRSRRTGRLIVVTGVSGGVGTSEAAIALADLAGTPRAPAGLLDADDRWAALAQRLGCGLYPNVVAGAEALAREHADPTALLQPAVAGRVRLLAGARRDAAEVAGDDLAELAEMVAEACGVAVADAATGDPRPAAPPGPSARPGPDAAVLAHADDVVLVADASPAGAGRALDWLATNHAVAPSRIRVLFNRSDAEPFRRRELSAEIGRLAGVAGVWHAPTDPRVGRAAWDGAAVAAGPYRRAVAVLLADLDSRLASAGRRLRPSLRRRGRGA